MKPVDIIICIKDSMPWLRVCLNSLDYYDAGVPFRVTIVVSSKNTQSPEYVAKSPFNIIPFLHEWKGHAVAEQMDLGMKSTDGDYALWLDSDCFAVRDGWLKEMVDYNVDLVGPIAAKWENTIQQFCTLIKRDIYEPYLQRCPDKLKCCKVNGVNYDVVRYFTQLVAREKSVKILPIEKGKYGLEMIEFAHHVRLTSDRAFRSTRGEINLKKAKSRDENLLELDWIKKLNYPSRWE